MSIAALAASEFVLKQVISYQLIVAKIMGDDLFSAPTCRIESVQRIDGRNDAFNSRHLSLQNSAPLSSRPVGRFIV